MTGGWRRRLLVLMVAGIPAFTGWPLTLVDRPVMPGLGAGWLGYFLVVHLLVWRCCGGRRYADILAVAALVCLPVVYGGATVAALLALWQDLPAAQRAADAAHYLALAVTMLTVVPLALALVVQVPFQRLEQRLLAGHRGAGRVEKSVLMALRVFNHIVYFVIPNILEVLREERNQGGRPRWRRLLATMTQVGVEGICAAVRYIPLWAMEIAALPDPEK